MTICKRMVVRILLFLARYINDDPHFAEELKHLSNYITTERFEAGK